MPSEDGYTTEEQKLLDETRKILEDQSIMVTATAVRIPVVGGHSEAVNVEFEKEFDIDEGRPLSRHFPAISFMMTLSVMNTPCR